MNRSLIKNLDKKWWDAFFAEGNIRLQPLSYFKTSPDPEKRDKDEGTRGVRVQPKETVRSEFYELSLGNVAIRSVGPYKTFVHAEPGSKVDLRETLPEVYVFCVSEVRCEGHGDAAYSINDVDDFV